MEYILPLLSVFISLVALYFSYTVTYSEEILLRKLKKLKFDFILVPNQQCSSLPSTQFIEKLNNLTYTKITSKKTGYVKPNIACLFKKCLGVIGC